MKKSIIKKFSSKALAVATGTAVMMSAYAPTLASAAEEGTLYISEVYLSYGDTPDKAKQWLEDNDFTVLDQDLNEDAEGGVSWLGLGSEKRCVYLGYKTTTEKDEAITDMRAMNMNGDFSYDDYEVLLKNQRTEINAFVGNIKTALAEYRANYKKGVVKAQIAHDKMNTIFDDDCDFAGLGDLLLKPIKEEMTEEEYNKAPKEHVDMTTLIMQGNVNNVSDLLSNLSMAADTAEDSWAARLSKSKGIEGLIDRYEKEYSGLSESAVTSIMVSEYDEQAKLLAGKIFALHDYLKNYTECSVKADDDIEKVNAFFAENTDKSKADWSIAGTEYTILTEIKYEDGTLADLIANNEVSFDDADDRMALYPLIDAMSDGQRAMLNYVDFGEQLMTGNLDAEGWKSYADDAKASVSAAVPVSVYLGVDRSVFDPAGVALTSDARQLQSATGSNYSARLFGEYSTYYEIAAITTSLVVLGAGIGSLIHAGSLAQTAADLAAGVRSAQETLANETTKIADKFAVYLREIKADRVQLADGSEILINNLFTHPNASQMKTKLFQAFSTSKKEDTLLIEYTNKGQGLRDINAKPARIYKKFANEKANSKAVNDYNTALDDYNRNANKAIRDQNQNRAEMLTESSSKWKIAGTVLCIAGALLAIGSAVVTVYDFYQYYHQDYTSIPRKIVHESTDSVGRNIYTVYDCTPCNRAEQGFGNETLGGYGDMNGDVGKQWVALYTTKDKAAGAEITADIIAQKGSNKFPSDKGTTVRLFGKTDSLNIVSEDYGYNDKLGGLYIFSGTVKDEDAPEEQPAETDDNSTPDTASEAETVSEAESAADTSSEAAAPTEDSSGKEEAAATGSVVGTGVMIGSCVGSAALGALVCFLIIRMKRKESAA